MVEQQGKRRHPLMLTGFSGMEASGVEVELERWDPLSGRLVPTTSGLALLAFIAEHGANAIHQLTLAESAQQALSVEHERMRVVRGS